MTTISRIADASNDTRFRPARSRKNHGRFPGFGATLSMCGLLLLTIIPVVAQDTVVLDDKSKLRGDVIAVTDDVVRIADRHGRLVVVDRADVATIRRGRALHAKVRARLERTDSTDAASVFAVASWAKKARHRRDADRLVRRVVALDAEHVGAREWLGHVRRLDRWFPDDRIARREWKREFESKGYVVHAGAWVRPVDLPLVQDDRDAWIKVDGLLWRSVADLRRERGDVYWEGEWYSRAEAEVVVDLKRLVKRLDLRFHGAQLGASRVISFRGRASAEETVRVLEKVRSWFIAAHDAEDVDVDDNAELTKTPALTYVFEDGKALRRFAEREAKPLQLSREEIDFGLRYGHIPWLPLGQAVGVKKDRHWRHALVSRLGGGLATLRWKGPRELPDWIYVAYAQRAEIVGLDEVKTHVVETARYDRRNNRSELTEAGRKNWERTLRDLYKRKAVPSFDDLFLRATNELDSVANLLGLVLLDYMLTERAREWRAFFYATDDDEAAVSRRFREAFGVAPTGIEKPFRAWLQRREKPSKPRRRR